MNRGLEFLKRTPPLGPAVRILLLEDDPISVEIVGTYLRRIVFADVELHTAVTVADALALLAQADVELVVADLHLPDSAGAATVERLVARHGLPGHRDYRGPRPEAAGCHARLRGVRIPSERRSDRSDAHAARAAGDDAGAHLPLAARKQGGGNRAARKRRPVPQPRALRPVRGRQVRARRAGGQGGERDLRCAFARRRGLCRRRSRHQPAGGAHGRRPRGIRAATRIDTLRRRPPDHAGHAIGPADAEGERRAAVPVGARFAPGGPGPGAHRRQGMRRAVHLLQAHGVVRRRGDQFPPGDLERAVDGAAAHRKRGPARLPRAVRPAHRPAQSRAARRPLLADDRAGEAPRLTRWPCCSSTWTNSRR